MTWTKLDHDMWIYHYNIYRSKCCITPIYEVLEYSWVLKCLGCHHVIERVVGSDAGSVIVSFNGFNDEWSDLLKIMEP